MLEEKLRIDECIPSEELTNCFYKILEMLQESRQIIIKMRYGLNEEEYKFPWRLILEEVNKIYPEYPCSMHRIKDMERKAWIQINTALKITEFDIACNDLYKMIYAKNA